jgi:hypothetical protein
MLFLAVDHRKGRDQKGPADGGAIDPGDGSP